MKFIFNSPGACAAHAMRLWEEPPCGFDCDLARALSF
jgi:hypothetical protein